MGYAAAIGSLVEAGVSIYGDLSKKGPNTGEYSSTLNSLANKYILPYANNSNFWNLDIPAMENQSIQYGMANAPNINQFNMQQLQSLLGQALPGYQGMVGQMATNTQSLLQGQVPADVQNQIQRNMAQQAFTSGIGGGGLGTMLTKNAGTARALGLTSLGLQEQGFTQGSNLLSMAKNYLMPQPVNPLSLLPLGDLVAGTQWSKQAQFQASEAAYTAKANAAAARIGAPTSSLAGVTGDIASLITNLGKPVNTNQQTQGSSLFSSLSGLFGGGGGMGSTAAGSSGMSGTAGPGSSFTNADLFSAAYG